MTTELMHYGLHDALLEWCSERQEGSVEGFRDTFEWLHGRYREEGSWELSLYNLQILGHLEVDWTTRRWAATPTVVTMLDNAGGNAALVGARPRALVRRLYTLEQDSEPRVQELALQIVLDKRVRQRLAPAAQFLTAPNDETLAELCAILGIRFEYRVATRIRDILPTLDSYLTAGQCKAAPPGVEIRRLELDGRPRWVDVDDDNEPGAYEYQGYGAPCYHFVDANGRYEADKGIVTYAELRRVDRQVIYYSSDRQEMYVPGLTRLPMLAARCAVLRTALLPTFTYDEVRGVPTELGGLNRYANIPPQTYYAICQSTGQDPARGRIR